MGVSRSLHQAKLLKKCLNNLFCEQQLNLSYVRGNPLENYALEGALLN